MNYSTGDGESCLFAFCRYDPAQSEGDIIQPAGVGLRPKGFAVGSVDDISVHVVIAVFRLAIAYAEQVAE
jgi:hypothetical protein